MKIGFDIHGGDHGAPETVAAAVRAVNELGVSLVLYGDRETILRELGSEKDNPRIEIVHTTEVVENEDTPTVAIRRKKDSSLVVGLQDLRDKKNRRIRNRRQYRSGACRRNICSRQDKGYIETCDMHCFPCGRETFGACRYRRKRRV